MTDPITSSLGPVSAPPTLLGSVLAAVGLVPDRYVLRTSAVGEVLVAASARGVSACLVVGTRSLDEVVEEFRERFGRDCEPDHAPDPDWLARVDAVLAGSSANGVGIGVEFDLRSVSAFQAAVLAKAAEIPPGEVRPYGWVAAEIGRPGAVRAVGTALGRNPVPLLIPCHRVVRTDGRIGDYALGSPAKRAVLRAEGLDPDELEALAARGVRYVGDDAAGTFCHPTCAAGRAAAADGVPLRSADAALARGLRPCPRCRPVPATTAA